ncbi:MAG TPA: CPBP family glutamic-type intramembrane protease [Anaerolineales bacterium]
MSTREITSASRLQARSTAAVEGQYSFWQIIGIWAGATLPTALSFWVLVPLFGPRVGFHPGLLYMSLMVASLAWQTVLAYLLLRREVKPFTWQGVKDRLWLQTPSSPRTGRPSKWLFLWVVPLIAIGYWGQGGLESLNDLWVKVFPFMAARPYAQMQSLAAVARGNWWILGFVLLQLTLNYLLGEELIFRGILLPKMNGTFGKWDWLANHILFWVYHLHMLSNAPQRFLIDWIYVLPTRRFKSYCFGAIIHGADALWVIYMSILAIKGLV